MLAVVALGLFAARPAAAENPEKVFAGKIMLSDKRFPQQAKSASAYIAAIRKQSKASFQEDKASGTWRIYFAAFLKAPSDDVEIMVRLYDVSGRQQSLLTSFEQFIDQRGQRTVLSKLDLDKKLVGVNKDLLMVVESKGRTLAAGKFRILGEGERFTGKVDFSEDEAKKNDEE